MVSRNDPCWCGSGKKWKKCHFPNSPSPSVQEKYEKQYGIILKTPKQIERIRAACKLAATILQKVCEKAKEGVSTEELNTFAHELHQKANAIPAPLGYGSPPFPKSICTSLNEVICHGIPDKKPLQKGDILNIDVTCILDGYFGDCSKMVLIGDVSEEKKQVVEASLECLENAIKILRPGLLISAIGNAIEETAEKYNFSVVNQFIGHGVGLAFHEAPQVPHNRNQIQIPLAEGMTFTIEPMINVGKREALIDPDDHWTARTIDGKPSAQWEHTLLITSDGYEVLTKL